MTTLDTKITDLESIIAPFNFNDKLWAAKSLNTTGNPVVLLGAWHSLPRNDTIAIYGDAVAAGYLCGKWLAADLPKGTDQMPSSHSTCRLQHTRSVDYDQERRSWQYQLGGCWISCRP